jgi:YD repeat-containing protein
MGTAANRMTHIDHQNGSGIFARFDYVYDSVNRRTTVTREDATSDLFGYDPIDQVTSVNYGSDGRVVGYSYDKVGNRLSVTDNGTVTTYAVNRLNEYTEVGDSALHYDHNGNLKADESGSTYTYDVQNRLISAFVGTNSATFAYDPRNRRVKETINGIDTFSYFDDWSLIDERGAGDAQQARYIHGAMLDEILSKMSPTELVYYHHDSIESVTHLSDSSGSVVEQYTYDVFGAPTF